MGTPFFTPNSAIDEQGFALRREHGGFLSVGASMAGVGSRLFGVGAVVAAVVVTACQAGDVNGTPIAGHYTPPSGIDEGDIVTNSGCSERPTGPRPEPQSLPACCKGTGRCLEQKWLTAAEKKQLAADTCGGDAVCIPAKIYLAATGGEKPKVCKSVGETDGRCISVCVPEVSKNLDALPDDICDKGTEKCAPCVNPLTNKRTGACELGNAPIDLNAPSMCGASSSTSSSGDTTGGDDTNPTLPCPYTGPDVLNPAVFASCGAGAHCLAKSLIMNKTQAAELGPCKTKENTDGLCTPDVAIKTGGNFIAKTCTSVGNIEGRCLNKMLPKIAAQASKLPQGVCDAPDACAPCYDPQTGLDTGACTQTCDPGPKKKAPGTVTCPYSGPALMDPTYFASCGGSASGAHCLPTNLISDPSQLAQLGDCRTKEAGAGKCVPDTFITSAGKAVPHSCNSLEGAEGRCLNTVLPQVQAQLAQLPQSTCANTERCTPCYNPIDGSPTGACSQACDHPTRGPVTFRYCCDARGRCVPSSLVPASKRDKLSSCGGGDLCAPSETLQPHYVPDSCEGWALLLGGTYYGACVSDCVSVGGFIQNIVIKQGSCNNGYNCVPCVAQGSSTGACDASP